MSETNDIQQLEDYAHACERLEQAGYIQTEVSNFRRPDYQTAHNEIYWGGGQYLGLGPGAHSFLQDGEHMVRAHTRKDVEGYLQDPGADLELDERLNGDALLSDLLAFGLRNLEHGVNLRALEEQVQSRLSQQTQSILKRIEDAGYLEMGTVPGQVCKDSALNLIKVSQKGISVLDWIQGEILFPSETP